MRGELSGDRLGTSILTVIRLRGGAFSLPPPCGGPSVKLCQSSGPRRALCQICQISGPPPALCQICQIPSNSVKFSAALGPLPSLSAPESLLHTLHDPPTIPTALSKTQEAALHECCMHAIAQVYRVGLPAATAKFRDHVSVARFGLASNTHWWSCS